MTEVDSQTTPPSLLDERLEIETPERVTIVYDLAGIGSRFAAGTIDFVILMSLFLALGTIVVFAAVVALPRSDEARTAFFLAAIGLFTAVLAVYYLGFEWFWSGQTPGKRALKLRVLSDEGGPASAGAIFVRNIVRVADLVPFAPPYAAAGLVMFMNRRAKRIGDYAAGTIVVREREQPLAPARLAPSAAGALPGEALEVEELARIRAFLARAPQMIRASRADLGRRLAHSVAQRHGLSFDDPEQLLRLLAAGRTPRELREAQGPKP
jgi:uncharacterized RDD family membrane protein YckC